MMIATGVLLAVLVLLGILYLLFGRSDEMALKGELESVKRKMRAAEEKIKTYRGEIKSVLKEKK